MNLVRQLGRLGVRALALPGVHHALRYGLRPLAPLLPDAVLWHVPVVGRITVPVPGTTPLRMEAVAGDQIASMLHWRGLDHYEAGTMRVLRALLPGVRTFIDVGANNGLYSLVAAALEPACEVWAFEPAPRVRSSLERNVALSGSNRIHVEPAALGGHEGEAELHVPLDPMPTSASLIGGFRPGAVPLRVPLTTLDAFVARRGIARVELLKIDAEGSDAAVLRGRAACSGATARGSSRRCCTRFRSGGSRRRSARCDTGISGSGRRAWWRSRSSPEIPATAT